MFNNILHNCSSIIMFDISYIIVVFRKIQFSYYILPTYSSNLTVNAMSSRKPSPPFSQLSPYNKPAAYKPRPSALGATMDGSWRCCANWRSWIRPTLIASYVVALVVVLPVMMLEFRLNDTVAYKQEWFIGGLFVILAVPVSVWGIVMHLIHYNEPYLQKYIVR